LKTTIVFAAVAALGATMMLPAHGEPPLEARKSWNARAGHTGSAVARRGEETRVVLDAQYADIINVEPARAQDYRSVYVPNFGSGPRIIHVQPYRARASVPPDEPLEEDVHSDIETELPVPRRVEQPAPRREARPPREAKPRWSKERFKQSALPPRREPALPRDLGVMPPQPMPIPPADALEQVPAEETQDVAPKRNVLSVPPLAAEGPSPIKPTPRWRTGERQETAEEPAVAPAEIEKISEPAAGIPANVPLPPVLMLPPTSELLPPE